MAEAERVRQQHLLSGRGYEQTLGDRRKGKPGLLQSTGSQRFRHDLATEQEEEVMSRITSSSLFSRASLIAQLVKNLPAMQETPVRFLGWEDPLEKNRLPTPVFLVFPYGSAGKKSTCNVGDLGSIPGLGRFPGQGERLPTLAWRIPWTVSQTRLSDFHLLPLLQRGSHSNLQDL